MRNNIFRINSNLLTKNLNFEQSQMLITNTKEIENSQ